MERSAGARPLQFSSDVELSLFVLQNPYHIKFNPQLSASSLRHFYAFYSELT